MSDLTRITTVNVGPGEPRWLETHCVFNKTRMNIPDVILFVSKWLNVTDSYFHFIIRDLLLLRDIPEPEDLDGSPQRR